MTSSAVTSGRQRAARERASRAWFEPRSTLSPSPSSPHYGGVREIFKKQTAVLSRFRGGRERGRRGRRRARAARIAPTDGARERRRDGRPRGARRRTRGRRASPPEAPSPSPRRCARGRRRSPPPRSRAAGRGGRATSGGGARKPRGGGGGRRGPGR